MHTYRITRTDETGFALECEVGHYAPDGSWIVNRTTEGITDAVDLVRELNGGFSEQDLSNLWDFLRCLAEFIETQRITL